MKKYESTLTPKQITTASLETLVDLWEQDAPEDRDLRGYMIG